MTAGEKAKAKYLKRQAYAKQYMQKYNKQNKDKLEAKRIEYLENMTPEKKEKLKAYQREYQKKYNEKKRAKKRRKAYQKEYYQRKKRAMEQIKKSRNLFPSIKKAYPKGDPANDKYREVVRLAAQAYRALSPDEKVERIRIAYKNR